MNKTIISIIGARPQFIKHAPMQLQLQKHFNALTLHTGQHYDQNMSDIFFKELNIPRPNFLFELGGSKPQGEQTGIMMSEIEKICLDVKPTAILLYGDTNSTLAGTLVSAKLNIPQIHIEAGLRSFNRQMPEEINRIIADQFSQLLFCPTITAIDNLVKENIIHKNIFLSGDVMCDTLHLVKDRIRRIEEGVYYFATLHRPYNTDDPTRLKQILDIFQSLDNLVIFSLHPRTLSRLKSFGLNIDSFSNIRFIDPVGYIESLSLQRFAKAIITDSGGMQKEAYMLEKKCVTIRSETEWVETLKNGWNTLVFDNLSHIPSLLDQAPGSYESNMYGNGHASVEIVDQIRNYLSK